MKYTDYSIDSILGFNIKQEICKKIEIKGEISDVSEIMKYYNREKYPTEDQLEHKSLLLDIKTSTLKAWYRNQRQQERKIPSRNQKCSLPQTPLQDQGENPTTPPHSRTTAPSHSRTITSSNSRTTTPPQQRATTTHFSPKVQSPPSFNDGTPHPYFQMISEKIGISPPQTDGNVKTSPRVSPSSEQSPPVLHYQRLQTKGYPIIPTVTQVLPLCLPFPQYYGSPHLQFPVPTSSSSDNIQPLDLSKPTSRFSPENHGIKQSNCPEHQDGIKKRSFNNGESPSSPDLPDKTPKTSPEHQPRIKTSPPQVNQTNKIRTKSTKPSKARSTPSPKLSFHLSPPEKQSHFGSGLRQLVIEGRSFSP